MFEKKKKKEKLRSIKRLHAHPVILTFLYKMTIVLAKNDENFNNSLISFLTLYIKCCRMGLNCLYIVSSPTGVVSTVSSGDVDYR